VTVVCYFELILVQHFCSKGQHFHSM